MANFFVLGAPALSDISIPTTHHATRSLSPGQWGIIAFLGSEIAFFSTLIVSYLVFFGKDSLPGGLGGPTPRGVLSLQLVAITTICLLSSSLTIHLAERGLKHGSVKTFLPFWIATIALGTTFLLGTAYEWHDLIYTHGLTISRNLFGSTFYTLVGFHALHVTIGVLVMLMILGIAFGGRLTTETHGSIVLVSWYWHFVDAVWIVVFTVVYLLPRF